MPYESPSWDHADRMSGSDGTETHNGWVVLPCNVYYGSCVGIFLQFLHDLRLVGALSIDGRNHCNFTALEPCKVATPVGRYTSIQIRHTYTFRGKHALPAAGYCTIWYP
jgi:hypothetical protein